MLDRPPKPNSRPKFRPPSSDRTRHDRQRRYRQRVAGGERVAPAPYDGAVVEFLIRTQWLSECDAGDRRLVGLAIGRLLRASSS